MKRLLVTGVSGLLGANLAWLAASRYQVTGVMRGGRALPKLGGTAPFETLLVDLMQPGSIDQVLETAQPDLIIHCAALTEIDRCEACPEQAHQLNANLPRALARAAARQGVRMLHISTDAVFDGIRGNYSELDEPRPINVYAQSKLAGERAVAEENSDALIARVNFYGWSWEGSRSIAEFFYNNLSAGRQVQGFTDIFFCPLLVNDIIEILLWMLEHRLNGLYHVVSTEPLSKYTFACMLAREFGFDQNLIRPAVSTSSGLLAPRSPLLTLRNDKLVCALDAVLPDQNMAMRRYHALYQQGYPQELRSLFEQPGFATAA